MSGLHRFAGRQLGVATMHGKEQVLGPVLMRTLPLAGFSAIEGMDTDRFGAFSGEIARVLDPLEACRAKARHGAEVSGMDLVVASEGSFFPYPPAPFVPCNEEVIVLYDRRSGSFFDHRSISLNTVFGGAECTTWSEVVAFAGRMQFPDHGLLVRAKEKWTPGERHVKGIRNEGTLRAVTDGLLRSAGSCWVETDMRAMMNPTRMQVIAEAAERFAHELATTCPACGGCWFRITQALPGLPCAWCGQPTEQARAYLRSCSSCSFTAPSARPDGKVAEEPQHCGQCNP